MVTKVTRMSSNTKNIQTVDPKIECTYREILAVVVTVIILVSVVIGHLVLVGSSKK